MLSPSAIQRAEDLVGIAIPIVPLSWAWAEPARAVRPSAAATAKILNCTIFFLPERLRIVVRARYALVIGGQEGAAIQTLSPHFRRQARRLRCLRYFKPSSIRRLRKGA